MDPSARFRRHETLLGAWVHPIPPTPLTAWYPVPRILYLISVAFWVCLIPSDGATYCDVYLARERGAMESLCSRKGAASETCPDGLDAFKYGPPFAQRLEFRL